MEFVFEFNGKKAGDVSAADWQYQIHVKNYRYFTRVQFDLFSGLEILVKYSSLDNYYYYFFLHKVEVPKYFIYFHRS